MPRRIPADAIIARLAATHHGVVTRARLRAAGVADGTVDRRIASGLLAPIYRGVYVLGGVPLTDRGRLTAALEAGGPEACVSHDSSGRHWGLLPARGGRVHLTVPRDRRSRPGLTIHVVGLPERSITVRHGVRCTTVARTVVDIAVQHGPAAAERAWSTAAGMRLIRPADVAFELQRATGRPGGRTVATLAAAHDEYLTARARSPLERRALLMLRGTGIRMPAVNRLLVLDDETFEADLLWGPERVVVEVDGRGGHDHGVGFDADRERDGSLGLAGWRSLRWTRRDIDDRPERTISRLRRALAQTPLESAPDAPRVVVRERDGS